MLSTHGRLDMTRLVSTHSRQTISVITTIRGGRFAVFECYSEEKGLENLRLLGRMCRFFRAIKFELRPFFTFNRNRTGAQLNVFICVLNVHQDIIVTVAGRKRLPVAIPVFESI